MRFHPVSEALLVLALLTLVPGIAKAQIGILLESDELPHIASVFVGGANMDTDPNLELVYYSVAYEHVYIVDGVTGVVEWNSYPDFGDVYVAGWSDMNIADDNNYPGNYGSDPFVDVNQDGIMELTLYSRSGPTPLGAGRVYVIGVADPVSAVVPELLDERPTPTLFMAHPNPASLGTTVNYEVTADGPVAVTIHDVQGRLIRHLVDADHRPGEYSADWDATDDSGHQVANGLYFFQLHAGSYTSSRKALIVR